LLLSFDRELDHGIPVFTDDGERVGMSAKVQIVAVVVVVVVVVVFVVVVVVFVVVVVVFVVVVVVVV